MSENLKDILSHLNPDIDQDTLLKYIQGQLNAAQQHEVEKQLLDAEFERDAVEGLQGMDDQRRLMLYVDQLNRDLRKRTENKMRLRQKRELKIDLWMVIALVLILLLVAISYFLIYKTVGN